MEADSVAQLHVNSGTAFYFLLMQHNRHSQFLTLAAIQSQKKTPI